METTSDEVLSFPEDIQAFTVEGVDLPTAINRERARLVRIIRAASVRYRKRAPKDGRFVFKIKGPEEVRNPLFAELRERFVGCDGACLDYNGFYSIQLLCVD